MEFLHSELFGFILGCFCYFMVGVSTAHLGKFLHHSKLTRLFEILFWPLVVIIFIIWCFISSVINVFEDNPK